MDTVITFDEIDDLLKNPPAIGRRPNFFNLRELRKHIVYALKQLPHPLFASQGWSGMAMQPTLFALLDPTAFVAPIDPGLYATYETYDLAPAMKMKDNLFKSRKNMFTTYMNIKRAVYTIITKVIPEKFRISNNPSMSGWNQTMSINEILDQLDITYGQPGAAELLTNQAAWHAPHSNQEEPEALFLRLEQCQQVAILAKNEYTPRQMITNAVLILRQSNIFPTKDFDEWMDVPEIGQTWPILRAFFHKKYTKRMTEIMMNAGSGNHGYANANMFAGMHDSDSTTTEGTTTTIAAATVNLPGSTLGMSTTVAPEIASAIAQLSANQTAIMTQMAALSITPTQPPIQQITIPALQFTGGTGGRGGGGYRGNNYGGGAYNGGYNGGYNTGGARGSYGRGRGRGGRRGRESFSHATQGRSNIPPLFGGNAPATGGIPNVPNPVKRFNNWNYCFTCGYDVEDNHTSKTCPMHWRRHGHQEDCNRNNVQQYAAAGHQPSVKGQHKNQLPPAGF